MKELIQNNLFNSHKPLLLILAVFLLCEGYLFSYHSMPLTLGESDGIEYMQGATGPLARIDDFHGPGYNLAIRLVGQTGLGLFTSAKLVSLASGALFLSASWLIISAAAGRPNGFVSTLLISCNAVFSFPGVIGLIMLIYCTVLCMVWLENRYLLLTMPITASFISAGILALPGSVGKPHLRVAVKPCDSCHGDYGPGIFNREQHQTVL